jgi:hypothetical protein
MISAICEAELFSYAFDTAAYPVEPKDRGNLVERVLGRNTAEQDPQPPSLSEWEKALAGINAGGGTSCGVAIDRMRRKQQRVEQIVMVTDEGENTAPRFKDAYQAYADELKARPAVILVKIGQATNLLEQACAELGVAPQVFEFRGDYYSLPNVIPMLTYPALSEMVMEVLEYPLPKRKTG